MASDEESSIEEVRKRIYSKTGESTVHARRKLHEQTYAVESTWHHDAAPVDDGMPDDASLTYDPWTVTQTGEATYYAPPPQGRSLLSRITRVVFVVSALFFLVSAGIAGYVYYTGRSEVRQPELSWNGPVGVGAGDEVLLTLLIRNPNQVPLLASDLRVQFPPGTRSPNNTELSLTEYKESLGTIGPGETKTATMRAILFGPEESVQTIGAALEYRLVDSATVFSAHSSSSVTLTQVPVTLAVDAVRELTSGQPVTFTVSLSSNVSKTLRDVAVRATYPPGFQTRTVTPKATQGDAYWKIGDLPAGAKHSIVVEGVLVGNGGESRVFRFDAGQGSVETEGTLSGVFKNVEHAVTLERPFLDLALILDSSSGGGELVTTPNTSINGAVTWANNLDYALSDVHIEAKLVGSLLDRTSVKVVGGHYRSIDDTLIWTPQTSTALGRIVPGESGTLPFSFKSLDLSRDTGARNPSLTVEISARANRADEAGVVETLTRLITRVIKLETDLAFAPRAVWSTGPFTNTGPVPPRADETTTYSILWSLTNSTSDVSEAELTAELPVYVEWLGVTSPSDANIRYDAPTRQVFWKIGQVPAGAGYNSPGPEVAFQIALTPSVAQRGREVPLVLKQKLRAVDRFTGTVLETKRADLTTRLSTDPGMSDERKGTVAE